MVVNGDGAIAIPVHGVGQEGVQFWWCYCSADEAKHLSPTLFLNTITLYKTSKNDVAQPWSICLSSAPLPPQLGASWWSSCHRAWQGIVDATSESGAVRHGAECFNFYFPQVQCLSLIEGIWRGPQYWPERFLPIWNLSDFLIRKNDLKKPQEFNTEFVVNDAFQNQNLFFLTAISRFFWSFQGCGSCRTAIWQYGSNMLVLLAGSFNIEA